MHVEPGVLGQPRLHRRVLVGGIVVGNQVQGLALGRLAVDLAQELQPLGVRMLSGGNWALPASGLSSTALASLPSVWRIELR